MLERLILKCRIGSSQSSWQYQENHHQFDAQKVHRK